MKTLKTIAIILGIVSTAALSSCSNDDSTNAAENVIVYNGTSYTMTGGLIEDYGSSTPADDSSAPTHFNFDFTVTDIAFTLVTDEFETYYSANGANFGVYVELFSPGTSSFQAGTFTFVNGDSENEVMESQIDGNFFFTDAEIYINTGNTDADGEPLYNELVATGGTVIAAGSGNTDWSLTFNLTIEGGGTLTGSYSGSFVYSDDSD